MCSVGVPVSRSARDGPLAGEPGRAWGPNITQGAGVGPQVLVVVAWWVTARQPKLGVHEVALEQVGRSVACDELRTVA